MDAGAAEVAGIVDRLADRILELALAVGEAREAALAVCPVAGRHVDQHLRHAGLVQPAPDRLLGVDVGEEDFDAGETVGGGGAITPLLGQFGVEAW